MSPWRSCSAVWGSCKVMLGSPWSLGWSARTRRARSRAANAGSGSIGVGAVRNASNGSGMSLVLILLFRVGVAERQPGAHEQRLGGVQGAVEYLGDFDHGEIVQVPQGQHAAVVWRELLERLPRSETVQVNVPWVFGLVAGLGGDGAQAALLATQASPVIDQLVARDAQQPGCRQAGWWCIPLERVHSGQHGLGRELLGENRATAAGEQVAVDVG